jgi:aspartate carbamoyltransferase catalytic subunit|tara:strand:- start:1082 stop:1999 length:918 start_codon:yes stop_codon:yes gene_type:complete
MNNFSQNGIISIRDLSKDDLEKIYSKTNEIMEMKAEQRQEMARGKTLGYLFFEPSTRTTLSFQSAMALIGGTSFGIADATSSSIKKGESLADTVKIMSGYADVIVLRHSLDGASNFAAEISTKPVINAGSGTTEHPTQAILDLYTIKKELGKIDGKNIGIVGDLKYGRTVYSLLYGLSNYDVNVHLISPESLKIRTDFTYNLKGNLSYTESEDLDEYIEDLDVLYVTRIQKERFPDEEEYLKVKGSYIIDQDVVNKMKKDAILLHPLPRLDEISTDVDFTKQARYFQQAEYGKFTRAAILSLLLQ